LVFGDQSSISLNVTPLKIETPKQKPVLEPNIDGI